MSDAAAATTAPAGLAHPAPASRAAARSVVLSYQPSLLVVLFFFFEIENSTKAATE